MVRLPYEFSALKGFPGYFWHREEERLYSLKSGVLKPLKLYQPNVFSGKLTSPYYQVSRFGIKKYLQANYIPKITEFNHVIPLQGELPL